MEYERAHYSNALNTAYKDFQPGLAFQNTLDTTTSNPAKVENSTETERKLSQTDKDGLTIFTLAGIGAVGGLMAGKALTGKSATHSSKYYNIPPTSAGPGATIPSTSQAPNMAPVYTSGAGMHQEKSYLNYTHGSNVNAHMKPIQYETLSNSSMVAHAGSTATSLAASSSTSRPLNQYMATGSNGTMAALKDGTKKSSRRQWTHHAKPNATASYQAFDHSASHQTMTSSVLAQSTAALAQTRRNKHTSHQYQVHASAPNTLPAASAGGASLPTSTAYANTGSYQQAAWSHEAAGAAGPSAATYYAHTHNHAPAQQGPQQLVTSSVTIAPGIASSPPKGDMALAGFSGMQNKHRAKKDWRHSQEVYANQSQPQMQPQQSQNVGTGNGYGQQQSHQAQYYANSMFNSRYNTAVRQQFSIIRSRNPLNCLWNALAMLLFYRWQVSESPPPTFANTEWQSTLVIPPFSRSPNPTSNSRSSIGSSYAGGLSAAAAETGMVSTAERVGLVRDLLPEDRFPVRCVVRSRSLHRARQLGIHEAPGYSPLRDQRMAHGESSWADTTLAAQPDGSAPSDRLVEITATNSGYYEPHHTIQRHKVIPPEALQQTDVAILRCCEEYLPQDYNMSTTLGHKLFNTPLFLQFCDKMRVEASDEIQLLQQSLEMAMGDEDEYRDYLGGLDATNRSAEPGGTAYDRVMNMPHVSASRKSGNSMMVVGSPGEESFSPTISPSPSKQDTRVSGNHPLPYMDSPRSTDDNMRHPSGGAFTQYSQHAHSMPARATDELSGGYFEPMGANEDSTAPTAVTGEHTLPLAKRRRPESGSGMPFSLAQQSMTSGPEQGVFAQGNSPKSHWQPSSHHLQRLTRSPPNSILRSPALAGARLGPATLPPISQFAQQQQQLAPLSNVNASPMMISSPNISRGMSGQQRSSIGGIGGSHRRDTGDVYMSSGGLRRPSDTVTEGSGSGMGVGRDDFPRSEMEQIGILREENANLRSRLQRLEATVAQKHAEMQSWMTRIEKKVMGGGGLIEGDLSDHSRSQT
ncbi:hypothetical protein GGI07_000803 [Coemansia sp. Benny D115]|nr:hypothetical protein GGI07_000803 [Coemansia sp. Benny D115]